MSGMRSAPPAQSDDLALLLQIELSRVAAEPPGWTIATGLRAIDNGVTGDCLEIFHIDDQRLGVLVIDVAGRGAGAALGAYSQKEALKLAMRSGMDPAAALTFLKSHQPELETNFFSAFLGILDPDTGGLSYANAGHPPALVVDDAGRTRALGRTGPIVGFVDPVWTVEVTTIALGEALAIYTDGLIETRNAAGDYYGASSVVNALATMDCDEAPDVVDHLLNDLHRFHDGPVADDVTLVVLCRHPLNRDCDNC